MSSVPAGKRAVYTVREFFAPRHTPGVLGPNLLNAAISACTVVICCLLFGPGLGVIALMGAMLPFWETGRPLWARVRNSLLVSAVLTASMAAGVLVAPYQWAIVPASVAIIVVAGALYYTFMLTPGPSPVMMFYAAVLGTFFGADRQLGWKMVAVTAFAAVLTSLLLLVPLLFDPHGPQRRALAGARAAVRKYRELGTASEQERRLVRNDAHHAVNHAWLTLQSAWPATRNRRHRDAVTELLKLDRGLAATDLGEEAVVRSPAPDAPPLPGRPGPQFLLSHGLRGGSVEWFTAWRMGLAGGIAGYISEAVGMGHPYWAILAATIVINQWMGRLTATRRAAHRTVGTLLGVGVVWMISALHPSPWWTVVAVIVCMTGMYLILPMNYALALICITPMALLAVEASDAGATVASLAFDRFGDTVIGAAVAVAVTWGTSWVFPRRLVRAQSARSATAIAAAEHAMRTGDPFSAAGRRARAELHYELNQHHSILDRAVADDPRLADLAPAEHRVSDHGYAVLARAWAAGRAVRVG